MDVTNYDPSLRKLRQLDKEIETYFQNPLVTLPTLPELAPLDMFIEAGMLNITMPLPLFTKDEISITDDNGVLVISASHKQQDEDSIDRTYYIHESGESYARRIALPEGVGASKISASFEAGVLRITMPFKARQLPKEIKIN